MQYYGLSPNELKRRKKLVAHTKTIIPTWITIEFQDETSLVGSYKGYYLQISFSELHPLMVICLARILKKPSTAKQRIMTNELNLSSILGSHAINDEAGCYSYRATQWLDSELDAPRFFEILDRCVVEANRGVYKLAV